MGTHPIFESDFDCLTDMKIVNLMAALSGVVVGDETTPNKEKLPTLDYKSIYIEDPKVVLAKHRPDTAAVNKDLLKRNKDWINHNDEGKEVARKMINIPNTMPITPHGVYKFVDGSPYCWVFFPYDSDEDELSDIYPFAVDLASVFKERCAVGTIDLAYPSNKFVFGYLVDDTPMLFVKNASVTSGMLNGYIEQDSFTIRHWDEWGFRVTYDKLEDDFDGTIENILARVYEPQTKFEKINSIYMEWYRTNEAEYEERFIKYQIMGALIYLSFLL